jgi:SAM-dependent methyltransferase
MILSWPLPVEYVTFTTRDARIQYVARRFQNRLHGSVLDVGCDVGGLRSYLPNAQYLGVDVSPSADLCLNLETVERLPFDDASFDCVVCIDVLEHLDNLHTIWREIVRVARTSIVISWHNCWVNARRPLTRGTGGFSHYGLPFERPLDRHKWFFSLEQAATFVDASCAAMPITLEEVFATEKPRPAPLRWLRRLRYPSQLRYLNRYAHTLWTVFSLSR